MLFIGTIEPRKNVDLLLDAYLQLRDSVRSEFDLLIAGPSGWKSEKTLARLKALPPSVRYLGYVPESEMPALLAGAAVFAYPLSTFPQDVTNYENAFGEIKLDARMAPGQVH